MGGLGRQRSGEQQNHPPSRLSPGGLANELHYVLLLHARVPAMQAAICSPHRADEGPRVEKAKQPARSQARVGTPGLHFATHCRPHSSLGTEPRTGIQSTDSEHSSHGLESWHCCPTPRASGQMTSLQSGLRQSTHHQRDHVLPYFFQPIP